MSKRLGEDFEKLKAIVRDNPAVQEYLDSYSVMLANMILKRRIELSMSKGELAQKAGITQATISKIEAADGGVKVKTLDKVFKALGIKALVPQYDNNADDQIATKEKLYSSRV